MMKATSAGGVVVREENGIKKVLLIVFEDGRGLGFPKGTLEEGETLENTAIREVKEETGLNTLKIIQKLGVVTRPSVQDDGTKVIKDIHLYLMVTDDYNHTGVADERYGWFTIDEAISRMAFPQEADFLRKAKRLL